MQGGGGCQKNQNKPISYFPLTAWIWADLSLAWAPGTESEDILPKMIVLCKSYTAQLKDSLGLEGQKKGGGVWDVASLFAYEYVFGQKGSTYDQKQRGGRKWCKAVKKTNCWWCLFSLHSPLKMDQGLRAWKVRADALEVTKLYK